MSNVFPSSKSSTKQQSTSFDQFCRRISTLANDDPNLNDTAMNPSKTNNNNKNNNDIKQASSIDMLNDRCGKKSQQSLASWNSFGSMNSLYSDRNKIQPQLPKEEQRLTFDDSNLFGLRTQSNPLLVKWKK